jgi:polar amino acid transport system substrate-binding protein
MNRSTARPALALVAGLALLATGCAPADEETTPAPPGAAATTTATGTAGASPSASADECAKESLDTVTDGKLTIATDQPVYEPWFVDNKPESGKGHEGAVAAAVAKQMGFTPTR